MKKFFIAIICFVLIFNFTITTLAHGGNTDSNGGHNDNVNGGYHYHHGYPAHDHPDGKCPFVTNTIVNSTDSDNESTASDFTTIIIAGSIAAVFLILAIISKKTQDSFFELPFDVFVFIMSSPMLVIYYLCVGIWFITKRILFALPTKEVYRHKMLERCWIDIDKINRHYGKGKIKTNFSGQQELCKIVAEDEKYWFYSYRNYSDGSGGYILRRDKKSKDNITFFGQCKKFNVIFHNYLFQADKRAESGTPHITATNITTGDIQNFNQWLSDEKIMLILGHFGRFYGKDFIDDMYISNDKLNLEISRAKSVNSQNGFEYEYKYKIIVEYKDYEFVISKHRLNT